MLIALLFDGVFAVVVGSDAGIAGLLLSAYAAASSFTSFFGSVNLTIEMMSL